MVPDDVLSRGPREAAEATSQTAAPGQERARPGSMGGMRHAVGPLLPPGPAVARPRRVVRSLPSRLRPNQETVPWHRQAVWLRVLAWKDGAALGLATLVAVSVYFLVLAVLHDWSPKYHGGLRPAPEPVAAASDWPTLTDPTASGLTYINGRYEGPAVRSEEKRPKGTSRIIAR